MDLIERIRQRAHAIHPKVVELRRDFHQHPELAFEEHRTACKVAEFLQQQLGLQQVSTGVAQTGVVAEITGDPNGPVIALRGDMDALPIKEANQVAYKSKNEGKMHACGHDVHTSSLLGTALILNELKEHLPGTIQLVFQPSEEKLPGGASVMVKENIFQNGRTRSIIGQHVMPVLECGKIGIRAGKYMASADEIYLTVRGKGGHAAQPHTTLDPVVMASQMIVSLQTVVSRTVDPRVPAVLSFGDLHASGATNIIPEEVHIQGTFRTFDEDWRFKAHEQIKNVAKGVVEGMGGSVDVDIRVGYPVLFNEPELTAGVRQAMEAYMGPENIVELDLWPAAEDFAYYTHEIPGCFYRLGTANAAKGITHGLHTPRFNIDEEALGISTGLMAWLALQELERQKHLMGTSDKAVA